MGCAQSTELLANTRTTVSNWAVNAIACQMRYNREHHLFPNVPFHTPAKVHELVGHKLVIEPDGYLAGQRKIIKMLRNAKPLSASPVGVSD